MTFSPDAPPPKPEPQLDLRTLLSYQNPRLAEYEQLIEDSRRGALNWQDEHSVAWRTLERFRKIRQPGNIVDDEFAHFEAVLGDHILVNLGATKSHFGRLLRDAPPRALINVDRLARGVVADDAPLDPFLVAATRRLEESTIDQFVVKADMLDFLARLPDESVNIEIDGIDDVIIPDFDYHRALADEIARVVRPGGMAAGVRSNALDYLRARPEFKRHYTQIETMLPGTVVYIKQ